jgi:hypothetical protein
VAQAISGLQRGAAAPAAGGLGRAACCQDATNCRGQGEAEVLRTAGGSLLPLQQPQGGTALSAAPKPPAHPARASGGPPPLKPLAPSPLTSPARALQLSDDASDTASLALGGGRSADELVEAKIHLVDLAGGCWWGPGWWPGAGPGLLQSVLPPGRWGPGAPVLGLGAGPRLRSTCWHSGWAALACQELRSAGSC